MYMVWVMAFVPHIASAHVGYLIPENEMRKYAGTDFAFLLSPLRESLYLVLMMGTVIGTIVAYQLLRKNTFIQKHVTFLQKKVLSYSELIPWMLRLSLGIALIGAGTSHVLISPVVLDTSHIAFGEIILGFLVLAGFLLAPVLWLAILVFLFALSQNMYLLGNGDFFAIAIAILIFAKSKPGLDNLLGIPFLSPFKKLHSFVPCILRIGIGAEMMFLAVYEKFLNPHFSSLVVERFHLTSAIPVSPAMGVLSAGLIEFSVGLALALGFKTRLTAAIAFCVLTVSFFIFGEGVSSHITLFGILSVLFVTGGGKWSVDSRSAK